MVRAQLRHRPPPFGNHVDLPAIDLLEELGQPCLSLECADCLRFHYELVY